MDDQDIADRIERIQDLKLQDPKQGPPKPQSPNSQSPKSKIPKASSPTPEREQEPETSETAPPLELGGFLLPMSHHPPPPPTDTHARDLNPGDTILYAGRPCEIVTRTNTLAQKGPLASRHQVSLDLIELFDKEELKLLDEGELKPAFVSKATEKLQRVRVERVRYTAVCWMRE